MTDRDLSYVSQEALQVYNNLFGTSLSGDFEGSLEVKLPGHTVKIYSHGSIISIYPDDPNKCSVSYCVEFIDRVKDKINSIQNKNN